MVWIVPIISVDKTKAFEDSVFKGTFSIRQQTFFVMLTLFSHTAVFSFSDIFCLSKKVNSIKIKPSLQFLFPFALYKCTMDLKIFFSSKSLNYETIKSSMIGAGSRLHV